MTEGPALCTAVQTFGDGGAAADVRGVAGGRLVHPFDRSRVVDWTLLDDARVRVATVEQRMTAALTDAQSAQFRESLVACARALTEPG